MVADVSSNETHSSSEDSASEDSNIDLINIAKAHGTDTKEPEKAAIARKRKIHRNEAGGKKNVHGQKDPKVMHAVKLLVKRKALFASTLARQNTMTPRKLYRIARRKTNLF